MGVLFLVSMPFLPLIFLGAGGKSALNHLNHLNDLKRPYSVRVFSALGVT